MGSHTLTGNAATVAKGKPLGTMAPQDWARTLDLMKQYQDVTTDLPATAFYTNQFVER